MIFINSCSDLFLTDASLNPNFALKETPIYSRVLCTFQIDFRLLYTYIIVLICLRMTTFLNRKTNKSKIVSKRIFIIGITCRNFCNVPSKEIIHFRTEMASTIVRKKSKKTKLAVFDIVSRNRADDVCRRDAIQTHTLRRKYFCNCTKKLHTRIFIYAKMSVSNGLVYSISKNHFGFGTFCVQNIKIPT